MTEKTFAEGLEARQATRKISCELVVRAIARRGKETVRSIPDEAPCIVEGGDYLSAERTAPPLRRPFRMHDQWPNTAANTPPLPHMRFFAAATALAADARPQTDNSNQAA